MLDEIILSQTLWLIDWCRKIRSILGLGEEGHFRGPWFVQKLLLLPIILVILEQRLEPCLASRGVLAGSISGMIWDVSEEQGKASCPILSMVFHASSFDFYVWVAKWKGFQNVCMCVTARSQDLRLQTMPDLRGILCLSKQVILSKFSNFSRPYFIISEKEAKFVLVLQGSFHEYIR